MKEGFTLHRRLFASRRCMSEVDGGLRCISPTHSSRFFLPTDEQMHAVVPNARWTQIMISGAGGR